MFALTDPEDWKQKRDDSMQSARACRAALTDPNGFWRLRADHPRVRYAVAQWVARARRFHGIALGRRPIIENFAVITNEGTTHGDLYAA